MEDNLLCLRHFQISFMFTATGVLGSHASTWNYNQVATCHVRQLVHSKTLPIGLVSKKRTGVLSTEANILLWSTREELTHTK